MSEETRLTESERAHAVRQLRKYLLRIRQVYDHSYQSQTARRWWPAFRLLDDMAAQLPFLIDWFGRDKVADYDQNITPWPDLLIDYRPEAEEERQEVNRSRNFTPDQKRDLWFAAGGRCSICRVPLGPNWHADHVVPWSKGGATEIENGCALCPPCNLRKHARIIGEDDG